MDIVGNRTLRSLLYEKADLHPDKPFLLFEDASYPESVLTYESFINKVVRLSQGLIDLGIKKGDRVTLHLQNSPEFLIAWFALASMGAIMVPTNILSTSREMEYIIRHSESVLLVTDEEYLDKLKPIQAGLPNLREILVTRSDETSQGIVDLQMLIEHSSVGQLESPKSEDIAAILYTSGTTSSPKGVLVTHSNYVFAGEVMSKTIRLGPDDRQLIVLPLFHGNAQYYSTMSALTVGASIALTKRFSASRYFKQAKQFNATVGSLFAAPIRMILAQAYDAEDFENNMRVIWFAQSISKTQLEEFETKFNTRLLQLYGMTETMGTPLMNPYDGRPNNLSIGLPVLGYEAKVVDESGAEVPNGNIGQLIIKGVPGRTIMKGYFNNPVATADTIRDGWLYTGDNARVDKYGYFHFVDRMKDMIKRAGENVAASEVEQILSLHPAVFDCAVIGIPDTIRDECIKAYVILKPSYKENLGAAKRFTEGILEKELISFCESRLAKFKIPEMIEFVTELPRTSVGKIQKHILRKQIDSDVISGISSLIEDPSKAIILMCLLDRKAILANELARAARIKPPTANPLLDEMVKKGLLIFESHEGHPYYRLSNAKTGQVREALHSVARPIPIRSLNDSSQSMKLHFARTCYDHLAGKVGVALADKFLELGFIQDDGWDFLITQSGVKRLKEFGISLPEIENKNRHLVRRCMDLSQLRHHMAGTLGSAITRRLFELKWIENVPGDRAIQVTDSGFKGFEREFYLSLL